MTIKTGDNVQLREDSEWANFGPNNPVGVTGIVEDANDPDGEAANLPVRVRWPGEGNTKNWYETKDLEVV